MVDVANFAARNFGGGPDLANIDLQRTRNALGQLQLNQEQAMGPLRQQYMQQQIDTGQANENRINQQDAAASEAQKHQFMYGLSKFVQKNPQAWPAAIQEAKNRGYIPQEFNEAYDPQKIQQYITQFEVAGLGAPEEKVTAYPAGSTLYKGDQQIGTTAPAPATPYQQQSLAETVRHNKAEEARAAGAGVPQGYEQDPTTPGALRPIAGGPHDPNAAAAQGARSELMFNRVVSAGNEATAALKNISELPIAASTGWFGTPGAPTGLLSASRQILGQKMSSQEVQDMKVMVAGVTRALGAIETSGLQVNGSLTHSMDAVVFNEGDSQFTKLRKMAEIRQIIEKGLEPNLSNPKIPPDQKKLVQSIIDQTKDAVPYTHSDLTKLQYAKNPQATVADYASSLNLGKQSGAQPPMTNSKGWQLHQDAQGNKAYVSPDGKQFEQL